MSYDLSLVNPKTLEVLELSFSHRMRGGTYRVGGEPTATLNITYNYSAFFVDYLGGDGIKFLEGKRGHETTKALAQAIAQMEKNATGRYWDATEGNSRDALVDCLVLACLCPDGKWEIS